MSQSKLILRSKAFDIPKRFKMMGSLSDDILNSLESEKHQYDVKSMVCEEIFQTFIQYLLTGKIPEIHIDNIFELSLLAQEFGISDLIDIINETKKKYREFEKILENQASSPLFNQPLSVLQQDLEQKNRQIFELQQNYNEIVKYYKIQQNEMKRLEEQIHRLKVDYQSDLLNIQNQVNKKIESIDQKIELIDQKVESIDQKVESSQDEFLKLINENNQNNQACIEKTLERLTSNIEDLNDTVKNQQYNSDQYSRQISELTQQNEIKDILNIIFFINLVYSTKDVSKYKYFFNEISQKTNFFNMISIQFFQ